MQAMRNARWISVATQSARRPLAPHAKKLSAVPKPGPPPFVYRDLFEQTEPVRPPQHPTVKVAERQQQRAQVPPLREDQR